MESLCSVKTPKLLVAAPAACHAGGRQIHTQTCRSSVLARISEARGRLVVAERGVSSRGKQLEDSVVYKPLSYVLPGSFGGVGLGRREGKHLCPGTLSDCRSATSLHVRGQAQRDLTTAATVVKEKKDVEETASGNALRESKNGGTKAASVSQGYGAEKIQVLQGLEPVRMRPGMYIGSTGPRGLHHLVYEVVDNAIDEAQAGFATTVEVQLLPGGRVAVTDNGRGIPTDVHPVTGKSALETVLTMLHAGGKFGGDSSGYSVSGGLHGVGVSVVNALSEELRVTVWRDGREFVQEFQRGVPRTDLRSAALPPAESERRGTRVEFQPDPAIFTTSVEFEFNTIAARMRELAFLNPAVTLVLQDTTAGGAEEKKKAKESVFHHPGGLQEYVQWLTGDKEPLHPPLSFTRHKDGIVVDVSLQWCADSYTDTILGYANSIRTSDGGTHLDGAKAAITRTLNSLGRKTKALKDKDENLAGEHAREGLTCVVSVKIANPEFEGQTKTRLGNPEARRAVDQAVGEAVTEFLELNPSTLEAILGKALAALKAAEAAKKARELVRRKSVLKSTTLPGKLSDCSCTDPSLSEIFIVEGDSAGGSAKQGRDRRFQAILPLRGKILNIERRDDAAIYKNTELQNLIVALGLGIKGEEFNRNQLRYHKIIILTDADVDGAHIRTLLLTFLFRYQRGLFEKGHVYVGVPPLYKVERGKSAHYCYTEEQLQSHIQKTLPANASYTIQRFKGLGEMMPQQLWDTTLDPTTRTLKQLTTEDAAAANVMFSMLMGDKVGPRKELIQSMAPKLNFGMLDV